MRNKELSLPSHTLDADVALNSPVDIFFLTLDHGLKLYARFSRKSTGNR